MNTNIGRLTSLAILLAFAATTTFAAEAEPPAVSIAKGGKPKVVIVQGSAVDAATELKSHLDRIVGAEFELATGRQKQPALYVGLAGDFPWRKFEFSEDNPEAFVLQSDRDGVYVVGATELGAQHGAVSLLHELGCRWFFPGETWSVIPRRQDVSVAVNRAEAPSFPTQRRIWYGYGAYGPCGDDWEAWVRHNRAGGPLQVGIGHSWIGLNPDKDFETHPEWFALVDGKRQPSKPCYSHPEVLDRATAAVIRGAERGLQMVTVTPPDGLGYCECDLCKKKAGVVEVFEEKGSLFGRRKDGELVNVTSETVFGMANEVAERIHKKHPKTLLGCYAYSAYSHPPSFDLHPNVYLQTTTAYRRTPLTLEQQLKAFGDKTRQLGIREYYSVYQWDWDYPDAGKMTPAQLTEDLRFFHNNGVTAVNGEASNNWAARGLGYYVAARLLWNIDADAEEIVRDFYQHAFGPAAPAMQRYYARWHGPSVAVIDGVETPERQPYFEKGKHNLDVLRAAFRDLDQARKLAGGDEKIQARLDELRMYLHYLTLRYKLQQAEETGDKEKILAAVGEETTFGGRLTYTNMIHTRPLLGKAFPRRFRKHAEMLENHPPAQQKNGEWRRIGTPPDRQELDKLWAADKKLLGL